MMATDEVRVYARHIRAAGMCLVPGAKEFCERHNIPWREFMTNGVPVSVIRATGDAMAEQVARIAENGK